MLISDKNKKLLKEAAKATKKLNDYTSGTFAAGCREENPKYNKLNSEADKAIRKLPLHLRSRIIIEQYM